MTGRLRASLKLSVFRFSTCFFPLVLLALPTWCNGAAERAAVSNQTAETEQEVERLAEQAEQLENDGKWKEAAAAYRDILKIDPGSIAALNRLGAIEVRQGQFAAGTRYYKQALALNPHEFGTNLNLGIAYIKMQDFGGAVLPLERAAEAEPDNFQARELLAGVLVGENDFARAIPELEKASELSPNDLGTLYLLERSYLETKQFDKALPVFERLQSLDPNSPWVRILRGQAEDGLGNYQKAIDEFETARQQLPHDATVRFSLGFMYWKVRRFTEAESELGETLRLDPRFEEAKYYLADTYLMDLKPQAALPLLQALVGARPRDARALLDLGKALEQLNRDSEAVRAYQGCLRADPERAEAHYQLARTYKKLKRTADFEREIAVAQKLRQEKRESGESLVRATGSRGDPSRQVEGLSDTSPPKP